MACAASGESDPWKSLLLRHRVQLVQSIRFRGTLLWDHLLQNGVVTVHQYQSQEGKQDLDMSRYVLDHITFKPQFDGFVKALRDSGQEHVADLLREESHEAPVSEMQILSINDVIVTLVAPWCDKGILEDAGITCEETWFVDHKPEISSNTQELNNMLKLLLHTARRLTRCMCPKESGDLRFTLNHMIVGKEVNEDTQDLLMNLLLEQTQNVVYFACSMARPTKLHKDISEKFSKLLELSSVFTDATYNEENESMEYPAHECITVGIKRPADDSSPWGGLLDMVVPSAVQVTDDEGRNRGITCETCPGAYALATAMVILKNRQTLGVPASDLRLLQSTRIMRRVLIGLCASDTPGHHQSVTGFGTLKPESVMKDQRKLQRIITDHIDYRRSTERSTYPTKKVNYTSSYTETCKESFLRQLTVPRGGLTHKVVVGIIGSGLNPSHPLLAGRTIKLASTSVCRDEPDTTLDWGDGTTSCTAGIVNMLCTAGGDSLLDNVHFVHVKDCNAAGTINADDYSEALQQCLNQDIHIIVHPLSRRHQLATWSGVELTKRMRDRAVFITPAWFDMSHPYHNFPRTECLSVNGILSDGSLSRDPAAGPVVGFLAPVNHQTTGDGRPLPGSNVRNAASFTTAVTVYILLLARKHGVEEWRCRRLSSTDKMRQILIQMCETPDSRTAERGHGVLDPWSHLMDWDKLKPVIMKYTDESTPPSLWAGKDI